MNLHLCSIASDTTLTKHLHLEVAQAIKFNKPKTLLFSSAQIFSPWNSVKENESIVTKSPGIDTSGASIRLRSSRPWLKKKKKTDYEFTHIGSDWNSFHCTAKFQNIDFLKNWLHIFHLFMHITLKSKENLHSFIIDKIENKKLGSQLTLLTVKLYTQFNRRALA